MCARPQRMVPRLWRLPRQALKSCKTVEIAVVSVALDGLVYGILPDHPTLWVLRLFSAKVTEILCRRVWQDLRPLASEVQSLVRKR